ncbi:S-4TM family putative pore-forming effector [Mesobacillus subterraneus]|uniref:S-4TM family putative pore-forming effector n=1 Tax=Mesobacillus subterraneus TaxID=285983 RepID=UPI00203B2D95|nr:S-4TM family putative pore-forming effector [Mesobacillus subterraneus]MCM3667334.1 S-4TM family putative pore-forming effector [Mesobacillus subterraneus]MCM3686321.1 S-4TM family putative pore-forming effector [Mesobacillus subterraneus]
METFHMHILKRTRDYNNINLLKARDHSYHQARKLTWLVITLAIIPVFYSIFSNITGIKLTTYLHLDNFLNERLMGTILSAIVYSTTLVLSNKIRLLKVISNDFREMYDCNVFSLPFNKYIASEREEPEIAYHANGWKVSGLYQVWYGETFSGNHNRNVLVCQADNISYAAFLYKKLNKLLISTSFILLLVLTILFLYLGNLDRIFFEVIIPAFTIFTLIFKVTYKSSEIQKDYMKILEQLREDVNKRDFDLIYLRMLQDKIFFTRSNDIITPRFIREKLLGENNEYKSFLNKFKDDIFGNDVNRLTLAHEIPIYSIDRQGEYTIGELHNKLLIMMKDVDTICSTNELEYILDGGSLLGAVRHRGFIPWDDDIDIAIKYEDLNQFYSVMQANLPPNFSIQSFFDDPYYSPVMPKFRIRMEGTEVIEKLHNASQNFTKKGIFIDVYTLDYSLKFKFLDKLYRLTVMLPIYQLLTRLDVMYKGKYKLLALKSSIFTWKNSIANFQRTKN